MNRKHLFLLLLLATPVASAQEASADKFTAKTLSEAASRVGDLANPLTIEVEVALTGPVRDIGPLVSYLRSNGFAVEGHLPDAPSTQAAASKPLTLAEADLASSQTLAISIAQPTLKSGESTVAFIVGSNGGLGHD